MSIRSKLAVCGLLPMLAFGVAACGDDEEPAGGGGGGASAEGGGEASGEVSVYSSLPLQGASKDQTNAMVDGIKLALKQAGGKAGNVTINYQSLDDSTAQAGNWDPQQTAANARSSTRSASRRSPRPTRTSA